MTDNETRRMIVLTYGRCECPTDACDPDCQACAHLDPEWTCYHDPEHPWPSNPRVGTIKPLDAELRMAADALEARFDPQQS